MATQKQKKAVEALVENRGSVSAAMRQAGYSEKTAKNPKNLTDSDAWKVLMEKYLDDSQLAKKHEELLRSVELQKFDFSQQVGDDEIRHIIESAGFKLLTIELIDATDPKFRRKSAYYAAPNARAMKDALDMAYKLKGKFASEKVDVTTKGEKVNIDDTQFTQLIAAANARTTGSGSGA